MNKKTIAQRVAEVILASKEEGKILPGCKIEIKLDAFSNFRACVGIAPTEEGEVRFLGVPFIINNIIAEDFIFVESDLIGLNENLQEQISSTMQNEVQELKKKLQAKLYKIDGLTFSDDESFYSFAKTELRIISKGKFENVYYKSKKIFSFQAGNKFSKDEEGRTILISK